MKLSKLNYIPSYQKVLLRLILPLISLFFKLSFLSKYWYNSSLCWFYISGLYLFKQHDKLNAIMLNILTSQQMYEKEKNHSWWLYMRIYVEILQEQQINRQKIDINSRNHLITLALARTDLLRGHDISYVFVGFSLWLFENGNLNKALELVDLASRADQSWGYPEYLKGWYMLFQDPGSAVEHFCKAVKLNWKFFHRMKQDRICNNFPEVIRKVRSCVLVQDSDS